MSKLKVYNCENCKHYDPDECYCMANGEHEVYPEDSCDNWESEPTEEELEAQAVDAAERENHRREVEGDEIL